MDVIMRKTTHKRIRGNGINRYDPCL